MSNGKEQKTNAGANPHPNDVETLKVLVDDLIRSLEKEKQKVADLELAMDRLIRKQFGSKSERFVDPNQLSLFTDDSASAATENIEDAELGEDDDEPPPQGRRRPRGGRRPLGENLKRIREEHLLDDTECNCALCGGQLDLRMIKGAELLGYRPPEYFVTEHYHQTGFCNCCDEHVIKAKRPPQMIPKGMADASMLAHVITNKKGDYLPLYRQEEISLRHGFGLPRSTQADWLKRASWTSTILYSWMASRVLRGQVIGMDETRAPVLEPGSGKVQSGRMWVYCGQLEVCPYLIYEYTRTKEGVWPKTFLAGYEGYLQADAANSFDRIFKSNKVWEVACGAHMRRYFHEALETSSLEARIALAYFRRLYKIERMIKPLTPEERREYRQDQALPILEEFKSWIDETKATPKSDLGAALRYAKNHWDAFTRYCDEGWLIIDNTRSERALRTIAIGRRNWLFYGNDGGGRTGAILSSLVGSAKVNCVSPYHYLEDIFEQMPKVRQHPALLPILQAACQQVEFKDGTRPNMVSLEDPIDYLRILKDNPRILTQQMIENELDPDITAALDSMLPDHWLKAHPEHYLPINRRTRLVGAA